MSRVRVAVFRDRVAAEMIRKRLLGAGVPGQIHGEPWLARLWFVSRVSGGVRIEVPAKLGETARELLRTWDATPGLLGGAIRCPECDSLRVDYPQFTQKSLFTNLAIGLMAGLGLVEKDYYCEDCHHMWPKAKAGPSRTRAHLAPYYFIDGFQQAHLPATTTCRRQRTEIPGRESGRKLRVKSGAEATGAARWHLRRWAERSRSVALALGAAALLPGRCMSSAAPNDPGPGAHPGGQTVSKHSASGEQSAGAESPTYLRDVMPILMGKCARCHNEQSRGLENWLDYKTAFHSRWEIKRRVWNSWNASYYQQPMPAGNSPETQAMTEEERKIIREWVKAGAPLGVRPSYGSKQSKAEQIEVGKRLFGTICAACHQPTGQGLPARFPPLAGSDFLNADKHRAIKVLVNGLQGEVVVNGQKFNNSMPRFPLNDQDNASVLTYVYNSFGNSGKEVTPEEVTAARAEKADTAGSPQIQAAKPSEEKSPFE